MRKLRYDFRDLLSSGGISSHPHVKRKRPSSVFYSENNRVYTTQIGAITRDDLMILCVKGVVRNPPPSTVQQLIEWNDKFGFGLSLRRCTNPDFISRALIGEADGSCSISRDSVEKSSSWLLPAISVDVDSVLQRVPLSAAGHLLLLTCHKVLQRFENIGLFQKLKMENVTEELFKWDAFDIACFEKGATNYVLQSEDFALDAKLLLSLTSRVAALTRPLI